jgi:hypothetical protein
MANEMVELRKQVCEAIYGYWDMGNLAATSDFLRRLDQAGLVIVPRESEEERDQLKAERDEWKAKAETCLEKTLSIFLENFHHVEKRWYSYKTPESLSASLVRLCEDACRYAHNEGRKQERTALKGEGE